LKKFAIRAFAPAVLFACSMVTAHAQPAFSLRAHIPFAFQVGSATLPAGDYTVRQDDISGVIMLQAYNGRAAAFTTSPSSAAGRNTQLVFERRNRRVVLTEIRLSDQPSRMVSSELTRFNSVK
jgi:hypothetical protein